MLKACLQVMQIPQPRTTPAFTCPPLLDLLDLTRLVAALPQDVPVGSRLVPCTQVERGAWWRVVPERADGALRERDGEVG